MPTMLEIWRKEDIKKGKAEGKAEGKADAVLAILRASGECDLVLRSF